MDGRCERLPVRLCRLNERVRTPRRLWTTRRLALTSWRSTSRPSAATDDASRPTWRRCRPRSRRRIAAGATPRSEPTGYSWRRTDWLTSCAANRRTTRTPRVCASRWKWSCVRSTSNSRRPSRSHSARENDSSPNCKPESAHLPVWLIDWLIELRFHAPLDTE